MKVYAVPRRIDGFFFDIDNTLYSDSGYNDHQYQVLYDALADKLGVEHAALRREVETWRNEQQKLNGGRRPSLGNSFVRWGTNISQSISWRSQYIKPEAYLSRDPRLIQSLERLRGDHRRLVAVTNNPSDIGWRTLTCLGVANLFTSVVGLDDAGASKPDSPHFVLALQRIGREPQGVLAVGDRYSVDVEPAMKLGCGGVVVDGVEDVYALPELILCSPGETGEAGHV